MKRTSRVQSAIRWVATGAGIAVGAYAAYVGVAWARFGHVPPPDPEDKDSLLDRFMPAYDIAERHHVRVTAPAAVTLAAARELDLFQRPVVRAILKARELILGASADDRPRPRGLVAEVQSLGWIVLDEIPDREIIVGAVTKPWEPNVTFRSIPADEFSAFHEPLLMSERNQADQ